RAQMVLRPPTSSSTRLTARAQLKRGVRMARFRAEKQTGQALGYFAAFVALGLTTASIGPTLTGLAGNTHSNLRQISFIFMARAIGYLVGSVLIGGLYDRLPGNPVLAGAILIISAMMGLVPTLGVLLLLLPVMLI